MTDAQDIDGGDLLAAELALRVLDREAETAARAPGLRFGVRRRRRRMAGAPRRPV